MLTGLALFMTTDLKWAPALSEQSPPRLPLQSPHKLAVSHLLLFPHTWPVTSVLTRKPNKLPEPAFSGFFQVHL